MFNVILMDCINCKHKNCCKQFRVPLTPNEHESGFYAIDTEQQQRGYIVLKKKESGECVYLDDTGRCTIYNNRPVICRKYDCTGDERILSQVDGD